MAKPLVVDASLIFRLVVPGPLAAVKLYERCVILRPAMPGAVSNTCPLLYLRRRVLLLAGE